MDWAWPTLALLGAYHGLNPAMGWLFAVALGLHRGNRGVVLRALVPIALGHALSVAMVALLVASLGLALDEALIRRIAGTVLIVWALYHVTYGRRHRVRFGMQVGMAGLGAWSFLMATAHGAGLMLVPALIPILSSGPAAEITSSGSMTLALGAVGVHTLAMLSVTGVVAFAVYQWIGVGILRRGWFNVDLVWTVALVATGIVLLAI